MPEPSPPRTAAASPPARPGVSVGRRAVPRPISVLLGCACLLMVFTFTLSDELDPAKGVDWVAVVKLLIRAAAGVAAAVLIAAAPRDRRAAVLPWMLPGLAFVGFAAASAAWSPLRRITLFQGGTLAVLFATAWACALHAPAADFSRVLRTLARTLLLISAGLLAARVLAPGLGSMERNGVSLLHATNAAATAAVGLIVTVSARMQFGWRWSRRLWPWAVLLHVPVLLISANRLGAVLCVLILGVVLFAFADRAVKWSLVLAACLIGAVYLATDPGLDLVEAAAAETGGFLQRGQSAAQLKQLSGREEMWTKMWASYLGAPLLGHGYFVTSETGTMEVWFSKANFSAHNLLLQVLVTTGAVGLLLFLAGLVAPPAWAAVRLLRTPRYRRVGAFALTLGAWYAGWGLLNESFTGPLQPESVLYFLLFGLFVGTAAGDGTGAGASRSPGSEAAAPA